MTPAAAGSATAGPRAALALLMEAGLLGPADLVDRTVRLRDASSRHRTVLVDGPAGGGLAVKIGHGDALAGEHAVHEIARRAPGLAAVLPRWRGGDPRAGWLARDLVEGRTLAAAHEPGRGFPEDLARVQGSAVGRWHADTAGMGSGAGGPHWALSAAATGDLATGLETARATWRATCLVHGDLKWDNMVVGDDGALRVVDWEGAGLGDPAWDVAGLLQEYLGRAEVAAAGAGARAPGVLRVARGTELGRAMAALFDAYAHAAGVGGDARDALARRATAFAGARLVQTALEHAATEGAAAHAPPTLLRLAGALLAHPDQGVGLLRPEGSA